MSRRENGDQQENVVITLLLSAALWTGVGLVREPEGYRVDFGPGATCMPRLPPGFEPLPGTGGGAFVRFEKGKSASPDHVSGTARMLDQEQSEARRKRQASPESEGVQTWTYQGAQIERRSHGASDGMVAHGLEIVMGAQAVRFMARNLALLPSPEAIVDSCQSTPGNL